MLPLVSYMAERGCQWNLYCHMSFIVYFHVLLLMPHEAESEFHGKGLREYVVVKGYDRVKLMYICWWWEWCLGFNVIHE